MPIQQPESKLPSQARKALAWAEIAGLVTIRRNGSWSLTETGRRELERLGDRPMDKKPTQIATPS